VTVPVRVPSSVAAFAAGLVLVLAGRPAGADVLQLKDGRFVEGVPMERTDAGVTLRFASGEVVVPAAMVQDLYVEREGVYEPKNDEEKAQLEKGLVRHDGKWVPKAERDRLVAKKREAQKKKIEEAKAHREWRNRYKTESKHFRFEYTIPPEIFEGLRDLLEAYYDTFTKKWKIKPDTRIGKPPVCLYHDQEYYYQVSGAPRGAIGYFRFVAPIELDLYYDRNDPRLTLDVLFHEGNHLLTHMIDPTFLYPPWVNESLAEYYGASQWDPATKTMSVGHVQEGRLVVLWDQIAQDKWLGLEEMIRNPSFDAIDYAWGWSFVHFLMETERYSEKFQKFYIGLAKDPKIRRTNSRPGFWDVPASDQIEAFKRYLGVKDLKALETEWRDYVKNKLKVETGRGYADAGAWAFRWDMKIKAKRFLQKAVEAGDTNPSTYATFARVHLAHGDAESAWAMYEKAISLDPLNATYYADFGRELSQRPDDACKARGKKMLALATEIAPDDAYVWLQTELAADDTPPAVAPPGEAPPDDPPKAGD
jgi:hypothetical protein